MRAIPKTAVDFIAAHEGVRLKAYLDSAQVPTIGYGHINGVTMGQVCTKDQALAWLADDLSATRRKLYGVLKSDVIDSLTENQWSALLSFVFNVGAGAKWGIWKRLNAHQFDQVPGELIKFVNAGGKKIQGLVNRRTDEIKLWSTDEPGSIPNDPPSSVTRDIPTPPTPADPVPMHKDPRIIGGAITAASAVPAGVGKVIEVISPYKDAAPMLTNIIAYASMVAAAAAVVVLVLQWVHKRHAQ